MPKGNRGSRGKSKGRANKLRMRVTVHRAPRGLPKAAIRKVLLDSLSPETGYQLPQGWVVEISWSNDGGKAWRTDEWSNAMADSSTWGRGWDTAVEMYLRG